MQTTLIQCISAHRQAMAVDAARRGERRRRRGGDRCGFDVHRAPVATASFTVPRLVEVARLTAGPRRRRARRATAPATPAARLLEHTRLAVDSADHAVGDEAARRLGLERGDDQVGERLVERDVVAAGLHVEQRRHRLHLDADDAAGVGERPRTSWRCATLALDLAVGLAAHLGAPRSSCMHLDAEHAQPLHRIGLAPRRASSRTAAAASSAAAAAAPNPRRR